MTSRPHDALVKAAFELPEHAADLFRSALPPELVERIAWASIRPEPGSFIGPDLDDFHTDLLFSAQIGDEPLLLYLLLEHKSRPEGDTPFQMLVYVTRIWERRHKEHPSAPFVPVVPLVVSHAPQGWTTPRAMWDLVEPHPGEVPGIADLVPRFSLAVLDLARWSNEDIKAKVLAAFPRLVLWTLRDARDAGRLLENMVHWAAAFAEAARSPSGLRALEQLGRYVYLVTDDLHYAQFRARIHELAPEAEPALMTIAEELRQEGRQQGLQQGMQQGKRQTLLNQLRLKFGKVADEDAARVHQADDAALERYVERVLTAESISAVLDN